MNRVLSYCISAFLIITFLVSAVSVTYAQTAWERRYAFVVTNQNHAPELMPLQYPHSDGRNVSAALKELGFNVRLLQDGSRAEFEHQLADFVADLKAAGPTAVAFFYFSGHCWPNEALRANVLILNETVPSAKAILQDKAIRELPADEWKKFRSEIYSNLDRIGVPLRRVTQAIGTLDTEASFVVIDSHLDVAEPALLEEALRPDGTNNPRHGMMLVARGRPGISAADNNDFSKALAGALLTPGLDAQGVFKQVQVQVAEVTNGKQVPWIEDRLLTKYHFLSPTGLPTATDLKPGTLTPEDRQLAELAFWKAIKDSTDPQLLRSYLEKFPHGEFVELVRLRVEQLTARPQTATKQALDRRVALVIGNSRYKHAASLTNPAKDARAIADALRKLGFAEVQEHHDLDKQAFIKALRTFAEAAATAGMAVVYYAGHGMEIAGKNYMLPIDAQIEKQEDVEDEAVPVSRLFDRLTEVRGVKIIILDACRENPFATRAIRRGLSVVGGGKGLAKMDAESGTLIALAADPGMPSYDGDGDNSPYASALLQHIGEPDLEVRLMFGKVYDTIHERMQGKQEPWIQAKLSGRHYYFKQSQ
jgi:uncharacterized caspase-like protein